MPFEQRKRSSTSFENGILEDARIFGDGYDFQIEVHKHFFLAETKGLRTDYVSIIMTQNEFDKAKEYNNDYALVVVNNLSDIPQMSVIFNPAKNLKFILKIINSKQNNYQSKSILWT